MADFNFMNSPSFGAEGGIAANQAAALNAISIGQAPAQTALIQARVRQASASALNETAEAGLHQMQLKDAQREGEILQNMAKEKAASPAVQAGQALDAAGQGQAIADRYFKMSSELLDGGAPVAAQKYAKMAIDAMSKSATISKNVAQGAVARLNQEEKVVEVISNTLGTAKSAAEFDAGKQMLMRNPDIPDDEKQHLVNLAYSPEAIKAINDHSLKYKDRINLEREQALADAKIREAQARTRNADFNASLETFQKKEEIRAQVKNKLGAVKTVPSGVLSRTKAAIVADHFPDVAYVALDESQKREVDAAALRVSERVIALQRESKMPESEAQTRAVAADRKNWNSSIERTLTHPFSGAKGKPVYTGSISEPLPFQPDAEQRVQGGWYPIPGKGYTLRWDPKNYPDKPWRAQ